MPFIRLDPGTSFSFDGVEYLADDSGAVEIPPEAVSEAITHGKELVDLEAATKPSKSPRKPKGEE